MPLRENQLKAKLKRGEVIIGTLMKSRGPYVVEAYAKAGVDYLDMDAEHTNFDMKELVESVHYAHLAGVTPDGTPSGLGATFHHEIAGQRLSMSDPTKYQDRSGGPAVDRVCQIPP